MPAAILPSRRRNYILSLARPSNIRGRSRTKRLMSDSTIDETEVARFAALADKWWDPGGDFKPLHRLAPARLSFIREHLLAHFGRDPRAARPFDGLSLLDIGCGGGLASEPMARLGFQVTGVDAAGPNIQAAQRHADEVGLTINYRHAAAEDLARAGETFDVVLALEIIEHVASPGLFLESVSALVRPGGCAILATINRTAKSFMLAIVGAEYLLRWIPRGTHDWRKFLRPSEIARGLRPHGLSIGALAGVTYSPASDSWALSQDHEVNYMIFAKKRAL